MVPACDKSWRIFRRPETRLQIGGSIVVEAEIGRREPLFQNCHAREQAHGFSFYVVWRGQQQFSITLKKCSCNPAHHILREGNGAIVQSDVNRASTERRVSHLEYPVRIQSDATELQVEGLGRSRLPRLCWSRLRRNGWGRTCLRTAHSGECESRKAGGQSHARGA